MNKPVQILLLIALFPMLGTAREETLEERKQRIVRKYQRKNLAVTQSEMTVPTDQPEDERIAESKKFLDAEVDLEKHDVTSGTPVMPPPPRPRQMPRAESNWLMNDMEDIAADGTDLNSDPYSSFSMSSGSSWDNAYEKRDSGTSRQDRSYNPYAQDDRRQQGYSENGQRQGSQYGSSFGNSGRTGIFGNSRQENRSTYSSGFNLQGSTTRTYGSDPSTGMLNSQYPRADSSSSSKEDGKSTRSYQPYKSSYDQQREQRSQQGSGRIQQSNQEYIKPVDSYEKFKDRNKTWNPMQDDAFISETMQKPKR